MSFHSVFVNCYLKNDARCCISCTDVIHSPERVEDPFLKSSVSKVCSSIKFPNYLYLWTVSMLIWNLNCSTDMSFCMTSVFLLSPFLVCLLLYFLSMNLQSILIEAHLDENHIWRMKGKEYVMREVFSFFFPFLFDCYMNFISFQWISKACW